MATVYSATGMALASAAVLTWMPRSQHVVAHVVA